MNIPASSTTYPFLAGGGELGELTRQVDWAQTSLGTPDQWPQSLRTTVSIILNSRFPMFLFWGPEHLCFYNDAYRPSLGVDGKHPQAIGKPGIEIWPEIWDTIKPLIDQVLAGQGATWSEDQLIPIYRNGHLEDVYWTFSYSPVSDESGQPAGVFVTCTETTRNVHTINQLKLSEKRFQQLTDTVPAILWLTEADGTCTYLNREWYDYTGQTEEEAKGLGWLTATHPDDSTEVERLFLAANAAQTPFYAQYRLRSQDGHYRWVIDKARPRFGTDGSYAGMIGTVVDIHHQKEAEEAAKRFKYMAENASDPFILMREDGTFAYLNKLALDRWGYTADEAQHIRVPDVDPIYNDEVFNAAFTSAQQSEIPAFETLHQRKDGTIYSVEVNMGGLMLEGKPHLFAVARDITERKKAEQAVRASESLFRNVTNSSPTGLWLSDEAGGLTYLNNTLVDWTGMPYEALLGTGWADAIIDEDRQRSADTFLTAVAARAHYDVLFRIRKFDDSVIWCRAAGDPYYHDDGTYAGYAGFCMDIDESVKQQEAIAASEAKLRAVIEATPAAIGLFVGRDLVIEVPNQPFVEIIGKGPDIVGKPLSEVMPELAGQPYLHLLDEVFKTGEGLEFFGTPADIVRDGVMTHNFYNMSYTPLFDTTGEVYAVLDVVIDVTDDIKERQKLEEAEATLRGAINMAQLGTWQIDLINKVFDYSERLRGWFGFTTDEVITRERAYSPVRKVDIPRIEAAIARAITPGSDGIYDIEYTVDAAQAGRERILHVMGRAFFDQRGQAYKLSGTAQDVTAQRKLQLALEQQVQERTEALEALNEEITSTNEELATINEELTESNLLLLRSNENLQQFAYIASHDLQEPLRKIQSFGDLLKAQYAAELGEGVAHLERMQTAASRMSTLIRDLLAFARISTQQDTITPVSLHQAVTNVLMDLDLRIQETGATITVGDLPTVQGDKVQLGQIFLNLLSNALKFHRPETPPDIQIQSQLVALSQLPTSVRPTRQAAVYHQIDVTDNGIGFDNKYLGRIFQVFQRLHGRNEFVGTGIGLAICEKVAANHGGAITATSQPGQGATFSVYLPALPAGHPPAFQ